MDSLGSPSVQRICGSLTEDSKVGMVAVFKDELNRVYATFHFREHTQLATGWFLSIKVAITVLHRAFQLLCMTFPEPQSTQLIYLLIRNRRLHFNVILSFIVHWVLNLTMHFLRSPVAPWYIVILQRKKYPSDIAADRLCISVRLLTAVTRLLIQNST